MILINGEPRQQIEATDRGLQYGDGVFETLACVDGVPQLWEAHMQRLREGCERLGIPLIEAELLATEVEQLCRGTEKSVVKIIVTRGSGGRGYRAPEPSNPNRLLFRHPWPEHAATDNPISLRLCTTPISRNPALAGIKHLNRLEQVMARNEWDNEVYDEGLMLDTQGEVVEGTMSNLFAVHNGELLTPALSDCGIAGVMRKEVLHLAETLQVSYRLCAITVDELRRMDEIFMTNSIIGIRAVKRFESTVYGDNPLTRRLQAALQGVLER